MQAEFEPLQGLIEYQISEKQSVGNLMRVDYVWNHFPQLVSHFFIQF